MTSAKGTSTCDRYKPVQEPCREQYLFLLEFYVQEIRSPRLTKLNEMFCVPTTVGFRFLDFDMDDELQLTPVDPLFEPLSGLADDVEPFYSGRSVLFALSSDALAEAYKEFVIDATVFKRMPKNITPHVFVGSSEINMSMHFAALRKEMIDNAKYGPSLLPNPSKCLKDTVPVCYDNHPCGQMTIFVRISAYGTTIMTDFDAPESPSASSFLFKAIDEVCEERTLKYKCRILDPHNCDGSSIFSETDSTEGKKQTCQVCKPPKYPCAPCRVPSGAVLIERPSPGGCQEMGKGEPDPTCVTDTCGPIQTSRGPKEPCGKAVVLKVSGLLDICEDGRRPDPCVTVAPESEAAKPCDLYDPEHDIFILRIGKKGLVGAGEKSDIQLEMRTPKGPERRRPVRLETREMQTEEGKGGKKGKGKKKK